MPRTVKEWIGKTDDTPVPDRVRMRVFIRDGGRCQCGCGIKIRPGDAWETDHTIAIINGGPNRESNLRTLLDGPEHHGRKTRADVAMKATNYRVMKKHFGLKSRQRSRWSCGKGTPFKKKLTGEVVKR
jgi:5-methylcytosine-specific restriction endonuclease McrA